MPLNTFISDPFQDRTAFLYFGPFGPATVEIDWGDGTVLTYDIDSPYPFARVEHQYAADGAYKIHVTDPATDDSETLGAQISLDSGVDLTRTGHRFDDLLESGSGDDTLSGRGGDDWLFGGRHDDLLQGGAGNDTLYGGRGADTFFGGQGDDETFNPRWLNTGRTGKVYFGEGGNDSIESGGGDDTLDGGTGNDVLSGEEGDDIIHGRSGDDELVGGDGNDTLGGGHGDDYIRGDAGADLLMGGEGADTLEGNGGADTLIGGAGADVLYMKEHADDVGPDVVVYNHLAEGGDTITPGFSVDEDIIALFFIDGDANPQFASGAAPTPGDDGIWILYDTGKGLLSVDLDGTGPDAAVNIAKLRDAPSLSLDNFWFG